MSGPALLVAPVLAVEAVVLAWALRAGHIARSWEALRGLLRAPYRRPLPAVQGPRLELKAPNPKPGQCPVCSLEDLDERAADDAFMGDAGTVLARVVPYGPDRAHSECAAVVPYVPPLRSTSGGRRRAHPGFWIDGEYVSCGCDLCESCGCDLCEGAQACAAVPLAGGRRMCLAHNEGDPRCTVHPPPEPKPGKPRESVRTKGGHIAANVTAAEMGPLPEVLTRPALGAYFTCRFCGSAKYERDYAAGEARLIEHARGCAKRPAADPHEAAHHHFGFYTPGPGATWTYCGCEEMREPPTGPIA